MKRPLATLAILLILGALPDLAMACERCFGAGSDAPAVRAVSASMLVLFALMTGVFGGIVAFFRNMSIRADQLAPEHPDSRSAEAASPAHNTGEPKV